MNQQKNFLSLMQSISARISAYTLMTSISKSKNLIKPCQKIFYTPKTKKELTFLFVLSIPLSFLLFTLQTIVESKPDANQWTMLRNRPPLGAGVTYTNGTSNETKHHNNLYASRTLTSFRTSFVLKDLTNDLKIFLKLLPNPMNFYLSNSLKTNQIVFGVAYPAPSGLGAQHQQNDVPLLDATPAPSGGRLQSIAPGTQIESQLQNIVSEVLPVELRSNANDTGVNTSREARAVVAAQPTDKILSEKPVSDVAVQPSMTKRLIARGAFKPESFGENTILLKKNYQTLYKDNFFYHSNFSFSLDLLGKLINQNQFILTIPITSEGRDYVAASQSGEQQPLAALYPIFYPHKTTSPNSFSYPYEKSLIERDFLQNFFGDPNHMDQFPLKQEEIVFLTQQALVTKSMSVNSQHQPQGAKQDGKQDNFTTNQVFLSNQLTTSDALHVGCAPEGSASLGASHPNLNVRMQTTTSPLNTNLSCEPTFKLLRSEANKIPYILFAFILIFYTSSFLFRLKDEFYKLYNNTFVTGSPFYLTRIHKLSSMKYFFDFNSILNQPFQPIFDDFIGFKKELWGYYLFVSLSISSVCLLVFFQNWFAMFTFQFLFSFYPFLVRNATSNQNIFYKFLRSAQTNAFSYLRISAGYVAKQLSVPPLGAGTQKVDVAIEGSRNARRLGARHSIARSAPDLQSQKHDAKHHNTRISKGFILTGPMGTGKKHFVKAIAGDFNFNLFFMNPSSLFQDRNGFHKLKSYLKYSFESIVFINKIDSFARSRQTVGSNLETKCPEYLKVGINLQSSNTIPHIATGESAKLASTATSSDAVDSHTRYVAYPKGAQLSGRETQQQFKLNRIRPTVSQDKIQRYKRMIFGDTVTNHGVGCKASDVEASHHYASPVTPTYLQTQPRNIKMHDHLPCSVRSTDKLLRNVTAVNSKHKTEANVSFAASDGLVRNTSKLMQPSGRRIIKSFFDSNLFLSRMKGSSNLNSESNFENQPTNSDLSIQRQSSVLAQFLVYLDINFFHGFIFMNTSDFNSLDKAFIRPGRFDRVIHFDYPMPETRIKLLRYTFISNSGPATNYVAFEPAAELTSQIVASQRNAIDYPAPSSGETQQQLQTQNQLHQNIPNWNYYKFFNINLVDLFILSHSFILKKNIKNNSSVLFCKTV